MAGSVKILMVLDAFYPSDLRLQKEISTLSTAGYDISLICYRRKGEKVNEDIGNLHVIRSRSVVTHKIQGLADIFNSIFFINPILFINLRKLRAHYDVVHVHDLAASKTSLMFASKWKAISILDLHENYPEALKVWFTWRKQPLVRLKNQIFFKYSTWYNRECEMVHSFDQTIAVVNEMKNRLSKIHKVNEAKITVVSNTEPKKRFDHSPQTTNSESDSYSLVYVGGIGPHRGLDTAILALPQILKHIHRAKIIIIGTGNKDTLGYLKTLSMEKGVYESTMFLGQKPFQEAIQYMQHADLNIIPHHKSEHTDNTIPHKLFQIMLSACPLLVSSCAPMQRIVDEQRAGLIFQAGDPSSFAEKAIWAFEHKTQMKEMSLRGRQAVQRGIYNWEVDGEVLLKMYHNALST